MEQKSKFSEQCRAVSMALRDARREMNSANISGDAERIKDAVFVVCGLEETIKTLKAIDAMSALFVK